jgi:hypothetical protein
MRYRADEWQRQKGLILQSVPYNLHTILPIRRSRRKVPRIPVYKFFDTSIRVGHLVSTTDVPHSSETDDEPTYSMEVLVPTVKPARSTLLWLCNRSGCMEILILYGRPDLGPVGRIFVEVG